MFEVNNKKFKKSKFKNQKNFILPEFVALLTSSNNGSFYRATFDLQRRHLHFSLQYNQLVFVAKNFYSN